ncbi:MAG: DNA polymerase, partial [Candidatus Limnocylindrus sp.]
SFWLEWPGLTAEERGELRRFFARSDLEIYGQSLNFDVRVMYANGIEIRGQLFDTMVASQLLHNGKPKISHSLKEIARRELGVEISKELQAQDWMAAELNDADIAYAMGDVEVTWRAAHCLHEKIAANGLEAVYRLECALIPAVVSMEHHGIRVDPSALAETIDFYSSEVQGARLCFLETLDGRLQNEGHLGLPRDEDGTYNTRVKATGRVRDGTKREAGFNLNSPYQVLAYFHQLSIEPVDDNKKPTLDKKVLARFQSDELVRMYLFYKRVEKRLGMAQKLQEHTDADGRIRARFMPLATGTGRFASSGPNLQNIPRDAEFRGAFRPEQGRVIVQADYSAMELRVAAAIAGEQQMIDAFNTGSDIHTRTAALMFGIEESEVSKDQRQSAKAINFASLYGSAARGVAAFFATMGMFITEAKARELLKRWHDAYPAFGRWHQQCQARAIKGEP